MGRKGKSITSVKERSKLTDEDQPVYQEKRAHLA